MTILKKMFVVVLTIAFAVLAVSVSGCTKYASQDDLQELNKAEDAVIAADKKLDKLKMERKQAEDELAEKKMELEAAQQEFDKVKSQ